MAGTIAGSLIFDTQTDTSGFERGTRDINGQTEQLSNSFSGLGKVIVATFSVVAIKEFGQKILETASDLNEVQNVVDTTFGKSSEAINQFADTALEKFGLSELSAKQFSSTIGAMFKSMGLGQKEMLEMSQGITGLSGDMASFYNLEPEVAFEKLRAGISGETEPLKQLGINMSVANLEAYALSEGITKAYSTMSQAEQATLRYKFIMQATADAQGDFAKTFEDSYASQTRVLKENVTELAGALGELLLPTMTDTVSKMNSAVTSITALIEAMKNGSPTIDNFKIAISTLVAALATYFVVASRWTILQNLISVTLRLEAAMRILGTAIMSPAGQLGLLVGIMVLFIGLAFKMNDAWSDMSGMEKAVSVLGLVAIAAAACAIAVGAVQSAATMGIAAVAIVGGTLAIGAAINRAQKQAESGMKTSSSGVKMPHLATGAVIPANGEFMAVLGDQKHGKNLEAPEGLIRQILREELGSRSGTGGGNTTVIMEIDGREFARTTAKYNTGETARQGVRLINGVT